MDTDGQRVLEFSIREKFYELVLLHETGLIEEFGLHYLIFRKLVQIFQMDDRKLFSKGRAKSSFGEASLERHLSSLKTSPLGASGSSSLSFRSPASCFAMTGPSPSAYPFPLLSCSLWWFQFSQYHLSFLFTHSITSNKWITRSIIPRIAGRSGKTRV